MKWAEFLGHQRQQKWFANAIAHNKLASTFLLVGPSGIGKRTFAKLIAKSLLCTETDPKALDFCNACDTCLQIQCETHPDFLYIKRGQAKNTEKEKSVITMEQLVGSKEARMREGFCYEIRIRPYSSRRRIGVIDDADTLDEETSNSLLKTLEEPPPGAVIFLLGTSEKRQISTIRSRCQIVRFSPLSIQNVEQLILRNNYVQDSSLAKSIAAQSHGSIQYAKELSDQSIMDFRNQIQAFLQQRPADFMGFSKAILDHVNSSTAEGQPRRDRLIWCLDEVTDALRNSLWTQLGVSNQDHEPPNALFAPLKNLPTKTLVSLIELTQEARGNINRFIAPAALLEAWTANFIRTARI
jgi:DNA polymerase-3 subunit delta'